VVPSPSLSLYRDFPGPAIEQLLLDVRVFMPKYAYQFAWTPFVWLLGPYICLYTHSLIQLPIDLLPIELRAYYSNHEQLAAGESNKGYFTIQIPRSFFNSWDVAWNCPREHKITVPGYSQAFKKLDTGLTPVVC
jgi:hypothetical protein